MPLSRRSLIACFSGVVVGSLSAPSIVHAVETLGTAAGEAPSLSAASPVSSLRPLRIAMLMPPDDSPFLAAARIVANGLAASNAHIDGPQDRSAEIFLVESSSQTASLDAALDAALVSGADIVVGPIERSAVEMLARKKTLPLPVLALNVPDNTDLSAVPQNLGLISISTEYEAEWIAQAAVAALPHSINNLSRPKIAVMAGSAAWQMRARDAFENVLAHAQIDYEVISFSPEILDDLQTKFEPTLSPEEAAQFDQELREALAKAESSQQRKLITKRVHAARRARVTQSEPPFQAALLALSAQEAALVRNRFPRGTRIWGTSAINPGDPDLSSAATTLSYDLDGVAFPECPLVVQLKPADFEARFGTSMPYSLSAKRLFALGVDARTTALAWSQGRSLQGEAGETGTLSFDRSHSPLVERTPQVVVVQQGHLLQIPRELAVRTVLPTIEPPKPTEPIAMPTVKEELNAAHREDVKGVVVNDLGADPDPTPMIPKAISPASSPSPAASGISITQ